jgi:hypothetical protein
MWVTSQPSKVLQVSFAATISLLAISSSAQSTPAPIPPANVNGVYVGGGWVEATNRQIVRTTSNTVYIVVSDDNACNSTRSTSSGVIRVYKGTGAQSGKANVPAAFSEVDAVDHPRAAGNGSCIFSGGISNLLFAPDIKLGNDGIIHIGYIDPNVTNNGKVYYQTFDTNTDQWGSRVQVASGAETNVGGGWPRGSHVALTLDGSGVPYIVFASGGTSNSIRSVSKTASGGSGWTLPVTIASGTNQFQPSMVTALDGTIHLAWCDNCLAAHPNIKYAKWSSGAWSGVETVSAGDVNVLGDGNHDQIPSITTDTSSRPFVMYLDGTVNGSNNYVRIRYRRSDGVWIDNTPAGVAGPSNPNGTWYCHTPTSYISSANDTYVFLGHDNKISPGPFQYQVGGAGNNWSAVNQLDPRNQSNVTAGTPGLDGSVSVRFDPLRDNNTGLIDLIYYDENDGTPGYSHHATVYYKAVDLYSSISPSLRVAPASLSFSAVQGGASPAPSTVNVTNAGSGAISFSTSSDSSWLAGSPANGNAPQTLSISANVTGMAQGTYTGHITVTAPGIQGSPATVTVTLNVAAASTLSSLGLNPTSLVGGASSTGTVTLSGPAPSGGMTISLSSSNPAAQVPASVAVVANASTANFTVTTNPVSTATSATISAIYSGTTKSATLTVNPSPATLSSVSVSPASVVGGNSSTGTVTLSGSAPSGGVTVSVSTNNSALQVPANVTVPANSTTANFVINTGTVSTTTAVTISGVYNSTTRSATLTVTPAASPSPPVLSSLSLAPSAVAGGTSSTGTVALNGSAPAGGASVSLSSSSSSAQVPSSVLVPAGSTAANFTVTTSPVASSTSATITAQYGATQTATLRITPATSGGILFGSQIIEPSVDSNSLGSAEAFQTTASTNGTLTSMRIYLDTASTTTKLYIGLYTDNAGHPGTLLTQGSSTQFTKGGWNTIPVTETSVSGGAKYWIAILGTASGTPFFRDRHNGPCKSETSGQKGMSSLPATWSTGIVYQDCPISAYGL